MTRTELERISRVETQVEEIQKDLKLLMENHIPHMEARIGERILGIEKTVGDLNKKMNTLLGGLIVANIILMPVILIILEKYVFC